MTCVLPPASTMTGVVQEVFSSRAFFQITSPVFRFDATDDGTALSQADFLPDPSDTGSGIHGIMWTLSRGDDDPVYGHDGYVDLEQGTTSVTASYNPTIARLDPDGRWWWRQGPPIAQVEQPRGTGVASNGASHCSEMHVLHRYGSRGEA